MTKTHVLRDTAFKHLGSRLVNFISSLPHGEWVIAKATTDSMQPTIMPGQHIRIHRVPYSSVRPNDIIAFMKGRRRNIFIHRVIRRIAHHGRMKLITKGDNLNQQDIHYIEKIDFIGKVSL